MQVHFPEVGEQWDTPHKSRSVFVKGRELGIENRNVEVSIRKTCHPLSDKWFWRLGEGEDGPRDWKDSSEATKEFLIVP